EQETNVSDDRRERVIDGKFRGWTRQEVRQLNLETQTDALRVLMVLIRRRGGEIVLFPELAKAMGESEGALKSALSRFSRNEWSAYHKDHWPIDVVDNANGSGHIGYRVPPEVLDWWFDTN
ncbi:MAG: hypothetical protein ACTHMX_00050, partial [Thermomicrobiales bacterium]